ncbi:MAG: hypothetical protein CXT71_03125 [Methanobacteriota archaeon]|nr:MAG: hypothetical protein CXT71_03125 [Euryarchaeota archaeon]
MSIQTDSVVPETKAGWIRFDLPQESMKGLVGVLDDSLSLEQRPLIAHSRLGIHDANGVLFNREIPDELMVFRADLSILLVSSDYRIAEVRAEVDDIPGLSVREFISPSGLMVQGTQSALGLAKSVDGVAATQPVPLAMLVDFSIFEASEQPVRIESWRGETLLDGVDLQDSFGFRLHQSIDSVANQFLDDVKFAETGRFDGTLTTEVAILAAEPSIAWIGVQPSLTIWNDQSRSIININAMRQYYTTDLDGSGQIVAVGDSGLDEDHGDFGTRVIGNVDIIGDGSTADKHSGHGTHVACTVLGDGSRGTYSGVAPEAELYFQAMENDNSGNFQWSSINNMLNTAYSNGARVHTNSWGSKSSAEWGVYTSSSEDVDDRARYYDQYYSGREGLVILFAAGNDGPDPDTIGSPATAKNTITVGNSQNRYSGAPNTIMSGSSRGPVDDGRIKPDILAPGGYVRSCRSQEATDTGGASWTSTWYLEYTGTSMATPNAAGMSALIRQYITEVAGRPEPQGALVKALMILGARDVGSRDIPNMNEGWGRIDLKNTLAPTNGRGIWVDDRSVLSSTGNTKSYSFNITTPDQPFKTVVVWSDERGSRFSNTQLVNDLDLTVTTPSGTEYKGNQFSQGRSIVGGTHDDLNNVEVVLIDNAEMGLWTVQIRDGGHAGSKAQPYAVAVSGVGVNDLRPDPVPAAETFMTDIEIPQVGDDVQLQIDIVNLGNVEAENVDLVVEEEGVPFESDNFNLGPGGKRTLFFSWQPQTAGARTISFILDQDDSIDEINEGNNQVDIIVNVTTPGVRIESESPTTNLLDINATTSSWQVLLTNTALISTNASLSSTSVIAPNGSSISWYLGLDQTDFELAGQESAMIHVTLVHPAGPDPGFYQINLLGEDNDNLVSSPFTLELDVPILADTRLEFDYQIIPVHPVEATSIDVRLFNLGNADVGYDLFLESPPGWHSGFDDLSAQGGANSGSTGLMLEDGQRTVGISFTPPQVMTLAGAELTVKLRVVAQTEEAATTIYDLPLEILQLKSISVSLENSLSDMMPGSNLALQYSIENRGNVDISISPRMELPIGWIQNTNLENFDLSWTQSKNMLISVSATDQAKSGTIKLILDGSLESWSEEKSVTVIDLAEPSMTFIGLEIEGETWDHIFGSGQHPAGVMINYTWLVSNDAQNTWNASVSLSKDNTLLGECDDIEPVGYNQVVPLSCTIIISALADVGTEPEFTVILEGDMVKYEEKVTMLVAAKREITWKIDGSTTIDVDTSSTLQITITNVGNTLVSHRIDATPPSGWVISFEGEDTVSLEAGQSEKLRLILTPGPESEKGNLKLSLADGDSVINSELEVDLIPLYADVGAEFSSAQIFISSLMIIGIIAGLFLLVLKKKNDSIFKESPAPTTPCWACRQPILTGMVGCPGCGARYHSTCEIDSCNNCQGESSFFIIVE